MVRHIVRSAERSRRSPMPLREPQDERLESIYNKVEEYPGEKPGSDPPFPKPGMNSIEIWKNNFQPIFILKEKSKFSFRRRFAK